MENFDNRASSLESEDRYRQLVELCPDLIAINYDDKIAFINSAGAKLLGAESPDQLIGRSVKDFIHTQNYELSRQRLQQLKQSKRVPSIEETFIRLDGTVFYAEASAMPITYCGKPAILVVAHDITERKLAEEALQENERRFLSLTQSIPDGIMLVDHNNTIIYWNHGSQNIFGYSEEEVLGKPSGMLLPEQDRETHRKGFEKLLQTGESSVLGKIFESRGLRNDGSIFPTEISISHWNTADGVCYCAVIRDISEHKLAEQQLRETKEYLDNLIDSSLDGIVAVNNDGHIIRANSYFMELIGYRREEVLGQRIARFFPLEPNTYHSSAGETVTIDEDHIKDFRDIVGRLFTEGKVDSWLTHIICKNSLAIPVSLNIVALHDRQQQVIGALGIIRNITEQKKAENKLRQSHETLRALINAAPESLFLLDIDGTVITANETLARRMGTTVNELVGANIYSYLPDDLIASRRMFAEQALKDKEMVYYEDVRGDRYMANYVYPFPGRNGDSTRVAVFSWDITDHKHAEEELRRHRDHLDELVRIKTAELTCANEQLQQKIDLHLRAEKSLRESEQNFRSLVQLSPDGIGISHHGTVVFINSAGARIFGAESFDQILGKQVVELVHPDYRELVENRMKKITSGGTASPYIELQLVRLDGSSVDVELGSTVCFYQNEPSAQAVFRDITKRKTIEKALLKSEDKFRMLAETVASAIIIIQGNAVVYANPAAETMCGYTFAEMQSHDFWDFVHPEHRERVGEWGRRRQQGEDLPSHYEVKLLTRGGTELWVDYTAAVIEYQGKPAVLGTGADITDRKRAEEALRRGEEKYRMLVQSANSIILRMDQHGAIIFLNEFGQQFFGFSEDEILGKNVIGTIVPQTDTLGSNLEEMILDIGRHPECYAVNENENMLRNGKRVWVSWTNKAILDDAGTISEILCIGHDITARKRAEEKLLSYQKQLQSLASELSLAEERERRRIAVELHDSIAQNLAISKIKISELREMTDHNSCGHIIDEIDLILQQTIRETRSLSFELCPPFLYELGFETALEWLAEQTSKKHGIALHFESDKQPKPLADDIRVVLFQATRELLANIAKHARARTGKVSITRQDNQIRIDVEDDGVGFDFTGTEARVGSRDGGFGLFSIRERMKYLGGCLECASGEGRGTRMSLVAPLKKS